MSTLQQPTKDDNAQKHIDSKITIGVLATGLLLIIIVFLSRSTLSDSQEWGEWVVHSSDVQRVTYSFEANLRTAESVQRSFILTGDTVYLNRLYLELGKSKQSLDTLRALTVDNAAQSERLTNLASVRQQREVTLLRGVGLHEQSLGEAIAFIKLGHGKQEMERIDSILHSVRAVEAQLQVERYAELNSSWSSAQWMLLTVLLVGILVLGAVYLAFRFDITKRLEAELKLDGVIAELRRSNTLLVSSNSDLESFASIASHDLQEPLRKIQSFSDLLKVRHQQELSPAALQLVDKMSNAALRMRQLIDNLLTFSRFSKGVQEIKPTSLNECVSRVLSDLDERIAAKQAKVNVGPLPVIAGDKFQLEQLFLNLIGNALKFSSSDKIPSIAIRQVEGAKVPDSDARSDQFYLISVKDNGIGFDEAYSEKIFGMFQRLHPKTEYEGTGIGLAICKKIVERHNGSIAVTSTLGEGTEFFLKFPR